MYLVLHNMCSALVHSWPTLGPKPFSTLNDGKNHGVATMHSDNIQRSRRLTGVCRQPIVVVLLARHSVCHIYGTHRSLLMTLRPLTHSILRTCVTPRSQALQHSLVAGCKHPGVLFAVPTRLHMTGIGPDSAACL